MSKLEQYKIYKNGVIKNKFGYEVFNSPNKKGYYYATIDGIQYLKHRLIWEHFNGEIPDGMEIDHINGNPADNRLCNLRLVTHQENMNNPVTKERFSKSNSGKSNKSYYQKMMNKIIGWMLQELNRYRRLRKTKYNY